MKLRAIGCVRMLCARVWCFCVMCSGNIFSNLLVRVYSPCAVHSGKTGRINIILLARAPELLYAYAISARARASRLSYKVKQLYGELNPRLCRADVDARREEAQSKTLVPRALVRKSCACFVAGTLECALTHPGARYDPQSTSDRLSRLCASQEAHTDTRSTARWTRRGGWWRCSGMVHLIGARSPVRVQRTCKSRPEHAVRAARQRKKYGHGQSSPERCVWILLDYCPAASARVLTANKH